MKALDEVLQECKPLPVTAGYEVHAQMIERIRRTVPVILLVVVVLASSGCLTLGPTVTGDTGGSTVFESVSTNEPWAGNHVRVNATLRSTPAAGNVTSITVIGDDKQQYSSVDVASGQTVVPIWVPANGNSTLVASNSVNSTTLGTLNVTPTGNKIV